MSRPYQIFTLNIKNDSKLDPDEDLDIPKSPWHVGGSARIYKEHWNRLLEIGKIVDKVQAEMLEDYSNYDPDELKSFSFHRGDPIDQALLTSEQLQKFSTFLENVAEKIKNLPYSVVKQEEVIPWEDNWLSSGLYDYWHPPFWEAFENEEYSRMCQAVKAVIDRCIKLNVQLLSYID